MSARPLSNNISLADTLALRMLRACPNAAHSMKLSSQDCAVLCEFRATLSQSSRKCLQLSAMNTPCISCHERCILNALAATQNSDSDKLGKTLEWLVPHWAIQRAREEFQKVADLLTRYGIQLDPLHIKAPVRREQAGLYAVIG